MTLRALADYLGIVGTNVLSECRDVDDEPACLASYGITVDSVFDEAQARLGGYSGRGSGRGWGPRRGWGTRIATDPAST